MEGFKGDGGTEEPFRVFESRALKEMEEQKNEMRSSKAPVVMRSSKSICRDEVIKRHLS